MCTLGTAVTLDQGSGDEEESEFWSFVGKGEIGPAVSDEAGLEEFAPVLYRVDGDAKKPLEKVASGKSLKKGSEEACLSKSALDDGDVFLVDVGWEIFIWIGKSADRHEKVAAMGAADRFAEMEPRANYLPVTIVKSGKETPEFLAYFD
jgi:hypothetical protein